MSSQQSAVVRQKKYEPTNRLIFLIDCSVYASLCGASSCCISGSEGCSVCAVFASAGCSASAGSLTCTSVCSAASSASAGKEPVSSKVLNSSPSSFSLSSKAFATRCNESICSVKIFSVRAYCSVIMRLTSLSIRISRCRSRIIPSTS